MSPKHIRNLNLRNKKQILFFLIGSMLTSQAFCAQVTTIVGNENSVETSARWNGVTLDAPNAVVKDPIDGSIIFSDNSNTIRKADPSGAVSPILYGFATPIQGITVDSTTGDIYGSDGTNIFKVTKSGSTYSSVSIIASNSANSSSLPNSWVFLSPPAGTPTAAGI